MAMKPVKMVTISMWWLWALVIACSYTMLFSVNAERGRNQTPPRQDNRGQSVMSQEPGRGQGVTIKVDGGKTIDLYGGSYALVIGAVNYQNWRKLQGVQGDADEVAAVLQKHGFKVEKLLDPTRESFDRAIRRFISDYGQSINNRLLIYFAGHGHTLTTVDGRSLGYIVPIDAPRGESARFKQFGISMDEISEVYARQIESKHVLFVFDSCFSGSVFATRSAGSTPPAIARNTAEPVRQFITAGSEKEEVPDRSIFRDYFVSGLEGQADYDKDGFVTGSELGLYLEQKVTNDPKSSQKPQWGKISSRALNKGDFVFRIPGEAEATANTRSRTDDLLDQARRALIGADHKRCLNLAVDVLRMDSQNGIAHRLASQASEFLGYHGDEIKGAQKAVRLLPNPRTAAEYEARCYAYITLGETERALADCKQAIRLDFIFALAYCDLAIISKIKRDRDGMLDNLIAAINADPTYADAHCLLGEIYQGKGNYKQALAYYSEAIRLNPKVAYYYTGRANAYRLIGRHDLAEEDDKIAESLRQK